MKKTFNKNFFMMKTRTFLITLTLISAVSGLFAQGNTSAFEGTWTLTVVDNILPDGTRIHLYGDNPQGILVFDRGGRYTLQIMSSDRVKFASGDKGKGTEEEYKTAMTGINTHFGKYIVDEASRTITFHIEHASYPNWEGVVQKRPYSISAAEFKYAVPAPTTGANAGATGEVIWKKLD
jgi:hypothetical protein